ncbi:MAG: RsmD family RNA methyltransferase, partial [Patescibacteria group bacterium]
LRGIPGPGTSELVILRDERKGNLWIGATCAVQDIQSYTERDMGKPFRDTKTGLLPPKLAQVLLNLSLLTLPSELRKTLLAKNTPGGAVKSSEGRTSWEKMTVWDPFCGSGVILLEALHRRAHVLGSDKSERAVKGAEENVQWFREKLKTPRAVTSTIWKHNALKSPELPSRPTVIVTETSLGPPLHAPLAKRELSLILRETEEQEIQFFRMLATSFPALPVVCTFPVYCARDGSHHFLPRIMNELQELGYRFTYPALKDIRYTDRHSLLYIRPDQFVGREILCLLPPMRKQEVNVQSGKEIRKVSVKRMLAKPLRRVSFVKRKGKGRGRQRRR